MGSVAYGGALRGGTYIKCLTCGRKRKLASGGQSWFRRHVQRNFRCMPWPHMWIDSDG